MTQETKAAHTPRTEEILGMLNAYRSGWISYDKEHVRSLKQEYFYLTRCATGQEAA